jgi:outer membrane beta-barrel protein
MMINQRIALFASSLAILGSVALPTAAHAQAGRQERKSPLADAPAIRSRVELRHSRFELGVGGGSTVGQDFYHAVLVGPRLSFHLNEFFAITGTAGFNVTPDLQTGFNEELLGALEPDRRRPGDRAPLPDQAINGMNRIGFLFSAGLEFMPFAGKMSLFGRLFANYDVYFFGGPGGISFQEAGAAAPCAEGEKKSICPVAGMKFGPTVALGAHAFINDFVALNLDVRDYWVQNNPAGRDVDGDGLANEFDLGWDQNFVVSLNVSFFLPSKPRVTD